MNTVIRSLAALALATPLLGAEGGCALSSKSDTPDVSGRWDLRYDDRMSVKIRIGGAVHTAEVGTRGGEVTIDHAGRPITFRLDCDRPEVVCPSEVWAEEVEIEQRQPEFPHRMWVSIPVQVCAGEPVEPDPTACGRGTVNPRCEDVCDGPLETEWRDAFGVIDEPGTAFDLFLGADVASNGVNCALLGVSAARAELVSSGGPEDDEWVAHRMQNGEVVTAYAGGCLWAQDADDDGELEGALLGASVELRTGFRAVRR